VEGRVEFFDASFIRLTRDQQPNLFIFKHDIKYLFEAESRG
jgi:sRNA-binding regulator protein Hfq